MNLELSRWPRYRVVHRAKFFSPYCHEPAFAWVAPGQGSDSIRKTHGCSNFITFYFALFLKNSFAGSFSALSSIFSERLTQIGSAIYRRGQRTGFATPLESIPEPLALMKFIGTCNNYCTKVFQTQFTSISGKIPWIAALHCQVAHLTIK